MLRAADSAATTTAEQDMDAILAREGFEAAPIEHPDNASKDSATKRAREVRNMPKNRRPEKMAGKGLIGPRGGGNGRSCHAGRV